jgi:hypothetical protein
VPCGPPFNREQTAASTVGDYDAIVMPQKSGLSENMFFFIQHPLTGCPDKFYIRFGVPRHGKFFHRNEYFFNLLKARILGLINAQTKRFYVCIEWYRHRHDLIKTF